MRTAASYFRILVPLKLLSSDKLFPKEAGTRTI